MSKIIIPTPLRKFTENQSSVEVNGGTVIEAIGDLTKTFPALKQHILDDKGAIRKFIRIYVGDDDIASLDNEKTAIKPGTTISIIPAIAGGSK